MKKSNGLIAILLSAFMLLSGCSTMSNALKGGFIGGGAGAALGAGVGALIGRNATSAAIGAGIGTALGATTGVIIGKKMDKAAAQAAAIEGARVDSVRDANNLKAVKVTFDSGILFQTNRSSLNAKSRGALTKFAKILTSNPTMDITILGHTDNIGTLESNQRLSQDRAQSVADFMKIQNIPASQFKDILGKNYELPVASNKTVVGRSANRRVEVYMYASAKMITDAQAQAK